jgi:hypothetical protein
MSAVQYHSIVPCESGGYWLLDARLPDYHEWFRTQSEAQEVIDRFNGAFGVWNKD